MSDPTLDAIEIAKAQEGLRQRRETFDQLKIQDRRWFLLRLIMGWVAIVMLPLLGIVSILILLHHEEFATDIVTIATTALLVDILGLVIAIVKLVLGDGPKKLEPTDMS